MRSCRCTRKPPHGSCFGWLAKVEALSLRRRWDTKLYVLMRICSRSTLSRRSSAASTVRVSYQNRQHQLRPHPPPHENHQKLCCCASLTQRSLQRSKPAGYFIRAMPTTATHEPAICSCDKFIWLKLKGSHLSLHTRFHTTHICQPMQTNCLKSTQQLFVHATRLQKQEPSLTQCINTNRFVLQNLIRSSLLFFPWFVLSSSRPKYRFAFCRCKLHSALDTYPLEAVCSSSSNFFLQSQVPFDWPP